MPGARRLLRGFAVTAALGAFALAACSDDVEVGAFDSKLLSVSDAGDGGNCVEKLCTPSHRYQCGNCIDDDFDGLIDSDDPDCLGPCDNTEDSYWPGIPGQNNALCKQDCFFDPDTGSGNDNCYWDQRCDPLSVAPDYAPSGDSRCAYNEMAVSNDLGVTCSTLAAAQLSPSLLAACHNYCLPLTPNGCDCFGCCKLSTHSNPFVWIGSEGCDSASVDDTSRCEPCTPVPSCFKPCDDPCKVCIGGPDVDPTCPKDGGSQDGGGVGQCPTGAQPCGLRGELPCDPGYYCITGCCVLVPT